MVNKKNNKTIDNEFIEYKYLELKKLDQELSLLNQDIKILNLIVHLMGILAIVFILIGIKFQLDNLILGVFFIFQIFFIGALIRQKKLNELRKNIVNKICNVFINSSLENSVNNIKINKK